MLGGTFDLGKSSIPNLLVAHEKGLPLTLVAAASINNVHALFAAFLLRKDSPIQTGRDFIEPDLGVLERRGRAGEHYVRVVRPKEEDVERKVNDRRTRDQYVKDTTAENIEQGRLTIEE